MKLSVDFALCDGGARKTFFEEKINGEGAKISLVDLSTLPSSGY